MSVLQNGISRKVRISADQARLIFRLFVHEKKSRLIQAARGIGWHMLTFACWWVRGAAGGRGAGGSLSYMRGHGTGAGQVPLSDALGCDSRGVRALAYITICVEDSTSRNYSRALA